MSSRAGAKTFRKYEVQGRKENHEDTDINSNIGVTAPGVRPDGNATDADADERNGGYGAGEREEDAPRASAAGQTSGKA